MTIVIAIVSFIVYLAMAFAIGKVGYNRARKICGCATNPMVHSKEVWNIEYKRYQKVIDTSYSDHEWAGAAKGVFWPVAVVCWVILGIIGLFQYDQREARKEAKHQRELKKMRRKHEVVEEAARHDASIASITAAKLEKLR